MLGVDQVVVSAWAESCAAEGNYNRMLHYEMALYSDYLVERRLRFDYAGRADVEGFVAWLAASHTTAVVEHVLNTVKRFYSWCSAEGIACDIAKGIVPDERWAPYSRRPLSPDDVRLLIKRCGDDRARAICSLLMRAALKPGEALALDVGDVYLSESAGEVKLQDGTYAALTKACCSDLRPYLATRLSEATPSCPLFVGSGNRNSGARLTSRSMRLITASAFEGAGLPGNIGDYNPASAAIDLAVKEREPSSVILSLGDRTYAMRRALSRRRP